MTRLHGLVLLLALGACHDPARSPQQPAPSPPVVAPVAEGLAAEPTPASRALPIVPLDATGAASAGPIALARYGDRTLAFVADAEDRAIVTFDVGSHTRLASTPLGARPSAVLVTPGARVVALGSDDARVHLLVLAAVDAPLVAERTIAVPDEPVSAAMMPAGDAVLVASRWGHALSVVPLTSTGSPTVLDLPRDPSAVVASADGQWALVTHAAGSVASVVRLGTPGDARAVSLDRKFQRAVSRFDEMPMMMEPPPVIPQPTSDGKTLVRPPAPFRPSFETITLRADQGFAALRSVDGSLLAPEVLVDTGPAQVSGGYGGGAAGSTATPAVASFDAGTGELKAPGGERTPGTGCLLPRGAAFDEAGKAILVTCLGSNTVIALGVSKNGIRLQHTAKVAKGPTGIAVDPAERRAVVWSAFDRVVSVLSMAGKLEVVAKETLQREGAAVPEDVQRGRALFHATFDTRVASDGRACASCHPDGRDDGLTWSSPNGPMQTPILFARLEGTAPYGWDGAAKDSEQHLAHTTQRLGGGGLSKRDVADIGAYLASMSAPRAAAGPDPKLVAHGAGVFRSAETECSTCHAGETLTDGDLHDVKSGPARGKARTFDTPSLRFVSRSAPYFHDGRYASLDAMLTGTDGAMGHTSQLSVEDRKALEAYLETL